MKYIQQKWEWAAIIQLGNFPNYGIYLKANATLGWVTGKMMAQAIMAHQLSSQIQQTGGRGSFCGCEYAELIPSLLCLFLLNINRWYYRKSKLNHLHYRKRTLFVTDLRPLGLFTKMHRQVLQKLENGKMIHNGHK